MLLPLAMVRPSVFRPRPASLRTAMFPAHLRGGGKGGVCGGVGVGEGDKGEVVVCASREERKKTDNKESFHRPINLQADTVPSTADDEESRLADGAEAAAVPLLLASLEVAPPLGVEAAFSAAGFESPPDEDSLCCLGDLSLFSSLDLSRLSSLERPPPPPPPPPPLPGDPAPSSS